MRCIDDFTASFINAATAAGKSIHHDTLDVLVALLHSAGEDRKPVRFRKDDFVGAYKTLPLRLEDLELAVTVLRDASGSLRTLQLHCCPFGEVQAFMRGTASSLLCSVSWPTWFLSELASEFIRPTGTATLARRVIQVLLGWELDAGTPSQTRMCS